MGAIAQGYVRAIDAEGRVSAKGWERPERDLPGVHVLFLSQHDLPDADARAREFLSLVPIVALTRGWRGLTLLTRDGVHDVPSLPRPEKDPTGAGDVFAAAFLVRYQEILRPARSRGLRRLRRLVRGRRRRHHDPRRPRRGHAPDGPAQRDDRGRRVGGVAPGASEVRASLPLPCSRIVRLRVRYSFQNEYEK